MGNGFERRVLCRGMNSHGFGIRHRSQTCACSVALLVSLETLKKLHCPRVLSCLVRQDDRNSKSGHLTSKAGNFPPSITKCRLQTWYKMQTKYKTRTENKDRFFLSNRDNMPYYNLPSVTQSLLCISLSSTFCCRLISDNMLQHVIL